MPIPYKHKRSTAAGVAPSTLQDGEIAINVAASDPKLFYKDSSSTIRAFSLASYASASHTHVVADVTDFTTKANVVSVNGITGVVSISHTDVTAASASHSHSASAITSGLIDSARLPQATTIAAGAVIVGTGLGVSSGTVSVTYGTTSGTACQGNDSRLSDARTPTSHSHGNITNAGAIGSTANLPIITTTSGVLTTGSFGTTAATFCEGNDSRLSDTRTPTDGSVTTAKLANDAVTYAKLQNVSATDRLLGRSSAGSGDVEEIFCTAFGRSLIGSADSAAARSTLSVQPTASPAFTGAATFANTGNVVPLTVTNAGTANSFVVNDASGDPTPFVIDASGNVGIKATSTASSLNVVGNSAFYQDANGTPSLGSKSFYAATFENFSAGYGLAIGGVSGATGACIVQVQSFTISAAYDMLLQPLGGNVGIGTTTPGGRLEVAGGQLLVTAGSGSAGSYKPGVAVSGDDDTGLQQVGGANTISLVTAGSERVRVKATGSVRFVPLSADPSTGNEAGDVYYNSTTNKLRVYNGTSWVDLH